ncbi:MAG: hypothetical protein V1850_05515 [Candidatus Bathyarchaeota archaeon]
MLEDVKQDVQPAVVSEGTPAPEVKAEVKPEAIPQTPPSTEDIITQRISEATKTFRDEVEAAKREIQSAKDKSKAEVERERTKAQIAEETLKGFRGRVGELDPEVAKDFRIAEYESRDKALQAVSQNEAVAKQQEEFDKNFTSQMNQFITSFGVDPSDKKIDWGEDAPNYLVKQQRILDSVAKIHKANLKAAEEKQSQVIKDVEAKIRKDLGLDSVDTSNPVGVKSDASSKAELNRKYAQGEISTKEYEEGSKKYQ